jgi:ribosomal protein L11 methyltransferase
VIRLAVRVAGDHAEAVLAELLELAPAGVEEADARDGTIEYAVYGPPGELPGLPDLRALAGDALVEISTQEIADDWHERWKRFHRPVLVSAPNGSAGARLPSVLVRPPWEESPARPGEQLLEIVIDPGQAFGTGAHASTRLCLELLLEVAASEPARGELIDVGTGSGVLAIAARGLGFAPVLALDNDPASVDAARANASVNRVELVVRRHDLRAEPLPLPPAAAGARPPVILANLLRPLLVELAGAITSPPAHLIAGGLLRHEVDEISGLLGARLGLLERARRADGDWGAVWLAAAAADTDLPQPLDLSR